jgi:hypothetical protein
MQETQHLLQLQEYIHPFGYTVMPLHEYAEGKLSNLLTS